MKFWKTALSMGLIIASAGCGFTIEKDPGGATGTPSNTTGNTTDGTGGTTTATYTQVYKQILQPKCIGCHGSGASPNLTSYNSFATNKNYVVAGDPGASQLYVSVQTGRMPAGGSSLSASDQALIYNWIKAGAQNN